MAAYLTVIVLLGATALALRYTVDVGQVEKAGIAMQMPAQAGQWRGRQVFYCHNEECRWSGMTDAAECPECGEPLFSMSWVEKHELPADTQMVKYRYDNSAGDVLLVSIVLSGRERNSIHRPQRCLVAQGLDIVESEVVRLPLEERSPLDVMVLDTLVHSRLGAGGRDRKLHYAYWFVGQGRETPYHIERMFWLAWDRVFRGVAHKWAYVTVLGQDARTREAFLEELQDFVEAWYPQVLAK